MGKVEKIIKSEVLRLAKREVRSFFLPLRREVRTMRLKLSTLSKNFAVVDRMAKERMRQEESKKLQLEASAEEVKASRFTPERIRNLRRRLGISQKALAILVGVTVGAVGLWEKGKFHPAANKKAVLVALRKLSKREVKKFLAEKKGGETEVRKPKGNAVKLARRKARPRKRVASKFKMSRKKR
jgi:DNA-binding transcriptional regulator YiaG